MFKSLKIAHRLTIAFLSLGILVLTVVSTVFYFQFKEALVERTLEQLSSVNMLKKTALEDKLKSRLDELYNQVKQKDEKDLKEFCRVRNILLFIEKSKKSEEKKITIIDRSFSSGKLELAYSISFNDNTYIFIENPDFIQEIMFERTGLGATGESYIVGEDKTMRTQSRFFSTKNPIQIKVNTEGVNNVLSGNEGTSVIKDYRGVEVLSAYRKISMHTLNWVLLSEIDEEEALLPAEIMRNRLLVISAVFLLLIVIVSVIVSNRIAIPIQAMEEMKNKLKDLVQSNEELSLKSKTALVQGQEEERIRLSKDIHDGVGPLLTSIKMKLNHLNVEEEERTKLKSLIDETIDEMRRVSFNLMPPVLLDFGASAAIKNMVEAVSKSANCFISFTDDTRKDSRKITQEINVALYRIAQETLNNAIKHSGATEIKISLTEFEDKVSYFISDNGKGFVNNESKEIYSGKGLKNIRERAALLNGEIFITSEGKGTIIEVEIPL